MTDSATPPDEIQPGTVLAETYRILSHIGEGGCAEVYAAAHTRLTGQFAVKVLNRTFARDPEALARFRQEAEITSALRHPNIVQVVDFNVTESGRPFLVMELLEGELLNERLSRQGAMSPPSAVRIVEQIARALLAAHARGIVHRDLKPDNIMLISAEGLDDFVKVLDFGISRASFQPSPGEDALIFGTPEYMAPEQALGESERVGPKTDQWALATIAYALLTGRQPFRGETVQAVLADVVHGQPPAPSELVPTLTAEVNAAIAGGLSKDPAQRYDDVAAFATAFRCAIEAARAPAPEAALESTALEAPATALVDLPALAPVAAQQDDPETAFDAAVTLRIERRDKTNRARVLKRATLAAGLAGLLLFRFSPSDSSGSPGALTAALGAQSVLARAAAELPDAAARLRARLALLLAR
jgi:serine/threonine protein kinase